MPDLNAFIQTFFDTDAASTNRFAKLFKPHQLHKNEFHTRQGQFNASLSFIKSGVLRIYRIHHGKEITQYLSSSGEFVTELGSLMFDQPARWHIQAITDVELFTISPADYQRLPELVPDWLKYERMFFSKCFLFIEDRVHGFLSLTAEERYTFLYQNKPEIFKSAPQQYIASMLGITPETFSRIRRKLIS